MISCMNEEDIGAPARLPTDKNKHLLFRTAWENYLKNIAGNNTKKTIERKIVAGMHFLPFFENKRLSNISTLDIKNYHAERRIEMLNDPKNNGKKESEINFRSINLEKATLSHFFNFCIEHGYIQNNPVTRIKKLNELSRLKTLSDSDTGNERRDYLIKQENVTRLAQLNLDENITSLIQSDEYARRLAKAVKLKEGDDWFINYVEHFKKHTPLKEVEDLSEYFVS